jgi:hypothetical protein
MENPTETAFNRTGAQSSPLSVHSMQLYADEQAPGAPEEVPDIGSSLKDGKGIAAVRSRYVVEAERIGSVPMPGVMTPAFDLMLWRIGGRSLELLIDKLGERLAFERSGVRLYQALIDKARALEGQQPLPFRIADLEHFRDDELRHMHILASALDSLGADSTAQTPSANVSAVACSGVMQVLTDPRTTIVHCLEAILILELADREGWSLLIGLTGESGQDQLAPDFQRCSERETGHVRQVRGWLRSAVLGAGA